MSDRAKKQPVIHPILFAVYPVAFLYHANREGFDVGVVFVPAVCSLAATLLLWFGISRLTGDAKRSAFYTSFVVLGLYSFRAVMDFLNQASIEQGLGGVPPATKVIASSFVLVVALGALCLKLRKHVDGFTHIINIVGLAMVFIPVGESLVMKYQTNVLPPALPSRAEFNSVPSPVVEAQNTPDIYYIVLDGYGRADYLADEYNFDNSAFLETLEDKGFSITQNSHANYPWTLSSITSALNFTYLHEILGKNVEFYRDRSFMRELLHDNRTVRFLRAAGYTIVAFESEYYEVNIDNADVEMTEAWFPNAFEIGLFQMTPFHDLLQLIEQPLLYDLHRRRILYFFEQLPQIVKLPGPKFIYAHVYFGHAPFVFGPNGERVFSSGVFDWRKAPGTARQEFIEGYRDQVSYLNGKVITAVDQVLAGSDQTPVVILQGDHGPGFGTSLTSLQETDVRERYSIFNAYLLPRGGSEKLHAFISPVNNFRVIFNHYFGTDYPLLEDEAYYTSFLDLYRFIPVDLPGAGTEALAVSPAAGGRRRDDSHLGALSGQE